MSTDSTKKTIGIAIIISLVCSVLVSVAAVSLRPVQIKNMRLDRLQNILIAADIDAKKGDVEKVYRDRITPILIELETGAELGEDHFDRFLNLEDFDIKKVAGHPDYGKAIPPDRDIAGIKRMPGFMPVYLVKAGGITERIIFPLYGKGLWSTMYGFMALDRDLRTIKGFTFYEHGETPGLGGEVDNPKWKATWKGKLAFDKEWNVKIKVLKGEVVPGSAEAEYQIDGLSGSTLTTRGVDNLVRFWLGPDGYAPYFKKLRGGRTDG